MVYSRLVVCRKGLWTMLYLITVCHSRLVVCRKGSLSILYLTTVCHSRLVVCRKGLLSMLYLITVWLAITIYPSHLVNTIVLNFLFENKTGTKGIIVFDYMFKYVYECLNLSVIGMTFDACSAIIFWKQCGKMINCSKGAIHPRYVSKL